MLIYNVLNIPADRAGDISTINKGGGSDVSGVDFGWQGDRSLRGEGAFLIIAGCDFHPGYQPVAVLDTETGEVEERSLTHASGEAETLYRNLARGALVGMEAVGNSQWFVGLLERLGHAVWIGDVPASVPIESSLICSRVRSARPQG